MIEIRKVSEGVNDLLTLSPELASQWHISKNGNLRPQDVSIHSGKKVWWQCEKKHERQSTIDHRYTRKSSCPYCNGKRVLKGFNDLETSNPNLAKEWHPTKNGDLSPDMVVSGSDKNVWWLYDFGH